MINVIIISVGKIKEKYWNDAIQEYLKRLRPYYKIIFKEIPEESISKITDRNRILDIEGKKIVKLIPSDAYIISLDRTGKEYTSNNWAQKLTDYSQFGRSVVFIIGGPLGLSSQVLSKSQLLFSLSKMTFTHQMARIILLEQLYRSAMIIKGKTYHY